MDLLITVAEKLVGFISKMKTSYDKVNALLKNIKDTIEGYKVKMVLFQEDYGNDYLKDVVLGSLDVFREILQCVLKVCETIEEKSKIDRFMFSWWSYERQLTVEFENIKVGWDCVKDYVLGTCNTMRKKGNGTIEPQAPTKPTVPSAPYEPTPETKPVVPFAPVKPEGKKKHAFSHKLLAFVLPEEIHEIACRKASKGKYALLEFMVDRKLLSWLTFAEAASRGDLATLNWLFERNCPSNIYLYTRAIRKGHLKVVQWAHAKGVPWDKTLFEYTNYDDFGACVRSHDSCMCYRWALENGCPRARDDIMDSRLNGR
jgi:hypothetical protein